MYTILRLIEWLMVLSVFYFGFKWLRKLWLTSEVKEVTEEAKLLSNLSTMIDKSEKKFPKTKRDKLKKKVAKFKENK